MTTQVIVRIECGGTAEMVFRAIPCDATVDMQTQCKYCAFRTHDLICRYVDCTNPPLYYKEINQMVE